MARFRDCRPLALDSGLSCWIGSLKFQGCVGLENLAGLLANSPIRNCSQSHDCVAQFEFRPGQDQETDPKHATLKWEDIKGTLCNAGLVATAVRGGGKGYSNVLLGDSTDLRDLGAEPGLVLGSPPYCTRIDYAMATRTELSVLGLSSIEQAELRRKLMGTTTVPSRESSVAWAAGETARRTLEAVRNHPSKASSTYYSKWLAQYLATFVSSLTELGRIVAPKGTIGIVVQGSYYKEILIDLPTITDEILAGLGWNLFRSYEFQPRRSLAHINPVLSAIVTEVAQRASTFFVLRPSRLLKNHRL